MTDWKTLGQTQTLLLFWVQQQAPSFWHEHPQASLCDAVRKEESDGGHD